MYVASSSVFQYCLFGCAMLFITIIKYISVQVARITCALVSGWRTYWKPERRFGMDMAGFAVNLTLIINKPNVLFPSRVLRGELESDFLSQFITRDQLEPRANNCTTVSTLCSNSTVTVHVTTCMVYIGQLV